MSAASDKSILIVEDDASLLELLQETLQADGWQVLTADNGHRAFANLIGADVPSLVLLDLNLPDINGMEIMKLVGEKKLPTQVIIMTSEASVEKAIEAMQAGAVDFLQKPINPVRVLSVVTKVHKSRPQEMRRKADVQEPAPGNARRSSTGRRLSDRRDADRRRSGERRDLDRRHRGPTARGDDRAANGVAHDLQPPVVEMPTPAAMPARRASDVMAVVEPPQRRASDVVATVEAAPRRRRASDMQSVNTVPPGARRASDIPHVNPQPILPKLNNDLAQFPSFPAAEIVEAKTKWWLSFKFILLILTLVLVVVVLSSGGGGPLKSIRDFVIKENLVEMEEDVKSESKRLMAILDGRDSLLQLERSASSAIKMLLRALQENGLAEVPIQNIDKHRDNLANIFAEHMRINIGVYQKIRLLFDGLEMVSVSYRNNKIQVAKEDELNDRSEERYYTELLKPGVDDAFISAINLHRRGGELDFPYTPVIRFSKVVKAEYQDALGDYHDILGVLVVNLYIQPIFESLKREGTDIYVANTDGYYLVHPDPEKLFGFDLGHESRFDKDYPEIAAKIQRDGWYMAHSTRGLMVGRNIHFDPNDSERFLTLVMSRQESAVVPLWLSFLE